MEACQDTNDTKQIEAVNPSKKMFSGWYAVSSQKCLVANVSQTRLLQELSGSSARRRRF